MNEHQLELLKFLGPIVITKKDIKHLSFKELEKKFGLLKKSIVNVSQG